VGRLKSKKFKVERKKEEAEEHIRGIRGTLNNNKGV